MNSSKKSPLVVKNRVSSKDGTLVLTTSTSTGNSVKCKRNDTVSASVRSDSKEIKSKLKELTSGSSENSFSSLGSKSKTDSRKASDTGKEKRIKKGLTNDKRVMESLHASYGSLGTGSFSSLKNLEIDDDSDEEFATPRQSITSPCKSSWKNKIHQKNPHGSPAPKKFMAPPIFVSPLQTSHHQDRVAKVGKQKCRGSNQESNSNLSTSAIEEFSTPQQSPCKTLRRKKTITPNPKNPTHVKTIFLQDCSDSSDSDHAVARKNLATLPRGEKDTITNEKEKKKVPKAISNYGNVFNKQHIRSANKIAALVRGHIQRMQFKIYKLQCTLKNMENKTISDIADIFIKNEIMKNEWYEKTFDRFKKSKQRQDKSLTVFEAHELIQRIRAENTDFRKRNRMLLEDVQKLKINNERLEAANKASDEFMDRIVFHEDSCSVEYTKLLKLHAQYENAVKDHKEHLALHVAYGECEKNAKIKYSQLLKSVLEIMENYKEIDPQFVDDINHIADQIDII